MEGEFFSIYNNLAMYSIALDTRNPELLRRVFAPDAVLDYRNIGMFTLDEFVAMSAQSLSRFDLTQHTVGLPLVRFDGTRAFSRCYVIAQHVINALSPDQSLLMGAWYDDEHRRDEAGWRISHRVAVPAWIEGNPKLIGLEGVPVEGGSIPSGTFARGERHGLPAWLHA